MRWLFLGVSPLLGWLIFTTADVEYLRLMAALGQSGLLASMFITEPKL